MEALATIRPDDWNLALFFHVLGAMLAAGALLLAAIYLAAAWRGGGADSLRAGFRTLLYGALPAYILMRLTAEWIASEEGLTDLDEQPAWLGIGYMTGDGGLLLLIVATVVAGVAARRARAATAEGEAAAIGTGGVRVATALISIVLVAYVVAVWAMTTKPA